MLSRMTMKIKTHRITPPQKERKNDTSSKNLKEKSFFRRKEALKKTREGEPQTTLEKEDQREKGAKSPSHIRKHIISSWHHHLKKEARKNRKRAPPCAFWTTTRRIRFRYCCCCCYYKLFFFFFVVDPRAMRDDDFFFDGPFFSFVLRRRGAMCFYPHRHS